MFLNNTQTHLISVSIQAKWGSVTATEKKDQIRSDSQLFFCAVRHSLISAWTGHKSNIYSCKKSFLLQFAHMKTFHHISSSKKEHTVQQTPVLSASNLTMVNEHLHLIMKIFQVSTRLFYKFSCNFLLDWFSSLSRVEKHFKYHHKTSHKMDSHMACSDLLQKFLAIKHVSSGPCLNHFCHPGLFSLLQGIETVHCVLMNAYKVWHFVLIYWLLAGALEAILRPSFPPKKFWCQTVQMRESYWCTKWKGMWNGVKFFSLHLKEIFGAGFKGPFVTLSW